MEEHYVLGLVLASLLGFLLVYALFFKKNDRRDSVEAVKSTTATTTTAISGECRSRNGAGDDVDVIIVGAGVAGAALAHTLGKV